MDCRISIEEKGEVSRSILIEIPRVVLSDLFNQELRKTTSQVRLKGFRPGRAPKSMVAKLYGPQIQTDVLNKLISDSFREAVEKNDLQVVGRPEIRIENENDEEKDLSIVADVSLYPRPEVKKHLGLEFEVAVEQLAEEAVEKRLQGLQEECSIMEPLTERSVAQTGDWVLVDYEATIDGQAFKGSSGKDAYVELGSGKSLPGVEAALMGVSAGEEREVQVEMPEDSGAELAGKTAIYKIQAKSLHWRSVPELNDEFAQKTGMAQNLDELRSVVLKQLERDIRRTNQSARDEALFSALIEANPFEVPQVLIDGEIRQVLMEMRFLDPSADASYKIDVSRFRDALGSSAEKRVRQGILLAKIIEKEELKFTLEEVDAWLEEISKTEEAPREEVNKVYGYPKKVKQLQDMMATRKAIDKMLTAAVITEKLKSEEEKA